MNNKIERLDQLVTLLNQKQHCSQAELLNQLRLDQDQLAELIEELKLMEFPYRFENSMIVQIPNERRLASIDSINSLLSLETRNRINQLTLFSVCDSTQIEVAKTEPPDHQVNVVLSEFQTQGRGRQGRRWSSPYGAGLCLSMGFCLPANANLGGALSLAIGIAVSKTIGEVCGQDVLIKWPNDLILREGKLGGILVNSSVGSDSKRLLHVGIGLNIEEPQLEKIDLAAHAMTPVGLLDSTQSSLDRAELSARLIERIIGTIDRFVADGFDSFMQSWRSRDFLMHQAVHVYAGDQISLGNVQGIQSDGALLVSVDGTVRAFYSGEVFVRKF